MQTSAERAPTLRENASQERHLGLLRKFGWNATSFQTLETGYSYWFDGDDAGVAYVDTGSAWVVAGAPVAPPERLGAVVESFVMHAKSKKRRVCLFAVEDRLLRRASLTSVRIGNQPVWDPQDWIDTVLRSRNLREQIRRAQRKGVEVRRVSDDELCDTALPLRRTLLELADRWLSSKAMAPMGFLVDVQPLGFESERRYFVAEHQGAVVGALIAVPIYARGGWLFEDILRDGGAPNGTSELLVDEAMRVVAAEGSRFVTLGLSPLAGGVPSWMRRIGRLTRPLYNFAGVEAFRTKLSPREDVAIHLAFPRDTSVFRALIESLRAFARGGILRFGVRSLLRLRANRRTRTRPY